jgi:hypothetical protein
MRSIQKIAELRRVALLDVFNFRASSSCDSKAIVERCGWPAACQHKSSRRFQV